MITLYYIRCLLYLRRGEIKTCIQTKSGKQGHVPGTHQREREIAQWPSAFAVAASLFVRRPIDIASLPSSESVDNPKFGHVLVLIQLIFSPC